MKIKRFYDSWSVESKTLQGLYISFFSSFLQIIELTNNDNFLNALFTLEYTVSLLWYRVLNAVSHNIFIGKLRKCGLDKRRVRHMPVKYSRGMESLACFSSQMDNNRVRANTVIAWSHYKLFCILNSYTYCSNAHWQATTSLLVLSASTFYFQVLLFFSYCDFTVPSSCLANAPLSSLK